MKYQVILTVEMDVKLESGGKGDWINLEYDPPDPPTKVAIQACCFLMAGLAKQCNNGYEWGLDYLYDNAMKARFNEIKKED